MSEKVIGKPFTKGVSGNPGGKTSIARDLEVASKLLTADQRKTLGLEPEQSLTAAQLRAVWWSVIIPVAAAGPKGTADTSWRYAHQEAGNRLMGKPKETVEIVEPRTDPEIDWSKVPIEKRKHLLAALDEIEQLAGVSDDDDAEP